jgi:hypothetical protein
VAVCRFPEFGDELFEAAGFRTMRFMIEHGTTESPTRWSDWVVSGTRAYGGCPLPLR